MHAAASECKTIILAYSKQVKSWFKIPPNKIIQSVHNFHSKLKSKLYCIVPF